LAFARSPDFNPAYYDPDVTYTRWVSFGATTFRDIDPLNAPWDPFYSAAGTVDLTQDIDSSNNNWTFRFHNGMIYPDGTTVTSTTDDKQVPYFAPTYYRIVGTADNSGYNTPVSQGLAPDGSTLEKYEIKPANYASPAQYTAAMQNFANWFSYYRKRHMAMRAGVSSAFNGLNFLRTGLFTINKRTTVTMWDFDTQSDTFYSNLYTAVGSGGTPNRQALDHAGKQYQRTGASAPITSACQQNFTIQFTDGYSTTDTSSGVGNADNAVSPYSGSPPFQDNYSNTLADIAMHYYKTNLRPDLTPGKVPVNPLDNNPDPHMVTFTVGLGVQGWIFGVTHNTTADAYATPPLWQDPNSSRDPVQIDELYHAAINGRGDLLNAKTPQQISSVMKDTLQSITSRTASASAVALNSGTLSTNSKVYQARFSSGEWSGQLLAIPINSDGSLGATLWDAGQVLAGQATREIVTWDSTNNQGVPFTWAGLTASPSQRVALDAPDGLGPQRLDYLRGDHSNEIANGGSFRNRANGFVLGDIVSSGPVFVGAPPFAYPESLDPNYLGFRQGPASSRTEMVYVGANDGMLHGFDATTGEEKIAYVPGSVYMGLNELTNPSYSHRYFVDGTPTVADVYYGSAWHTVLVSGMQAGGQGLFALDVTDPSAFTETNAAALALWEFTDADDADLGYTFGKPAILKMKNGKWAAVFGNGYNNTENDGNASTTGNAVLYIVDIATGALIQKIDTFRGTADSADGTTPNGLASPAIVDSDGDFVADYIYAGDFQGNLWKFDVTDSTPANWFVVNSGTPTPIFTATDAGGVPQPITVRPTVSQHPDGEDGYMVYFGTGKYLEAGDQTTASAQVNAFYGIWDEMGDATGPHTTVDKADLQTQTLTEISGPPDLRTITDNPITAWGTNSGEHMGWKVDLPGAAEKNVTNPILIGERVLFTTLIPDDTPCGFGGTGFVMELNYQNGGPPDGPVFDINGDGVIDSSDNNGGDVVVGFNPDIGMLPDPAILHPGSSTSGQLMQKVFSGSTGAVSAVANDPVAKPFRRRSWRQLQ
jgi:type IV pilus assembly protein PilY1